MMRCERRNIRGDCGFGLPLLRLPRGRARCLRIDGLNVSLAQQNSWYVEEWSSWPERVVERLKLVRTAEASSVWKGPHAEWIGDRSP